MANAFEVEITTYVPVGYELLAQMISVGVDEGYLCPDRDSDEYEDIEHWLENKFMHGGFISVCDPRDEMRVYDLSDVDFRWGIEMWIESGGEFQALLNYSDLNEMMQYVMFDEIRYEEN